MHLLLFLFIVILSWTCAIVSAGPDKIYSYICLSAEQNLCLGISIDGPPVYDPNVTPYRLQVKPRVRNEQQGLDWMKTRWTVYWGIGRIQLSNFTTMCIAKETGNNAIPGGVVLRPCGSSGPLEEWNLDGFNETFLEEGVIRLKTRPDQCLSMMSCDRKSILNTDYCDPFSTTMFTGSVYDVEKQRGSHVRLMPCITDHPSQMFRQRLDCAPGCSPYMMENTNNQCDLACANDACNWDNGACSTPNPTPPTPRPSTNPTTSPTTSMPSPNPTKSPSLRPTSRPSKHPTLPTHSPTAHPSEMPTQSPSFHPSAQPSSAPTHTPTESPTRGPKKTDSAVSTSTPSSDTDWWIWFIVAICILLFCCLCGWCFLVRRRRQQKEEPPSDPPPLVEENPRVGGGGGGGSNGTLVLDGDTSSPQEYSEIQMV